VGVTISILERDIKKAARALLLTLFPDGTEVVSGQDNRVGEPVGLNFVVMTTMYQERLSTNVESWDDSTGDPTTLESMASWKWGLQLDLHGPDSCTLATIAAHMWRSNWACVNVDSRYISPLFADDPHQAPFINGENQYENRWVVNIYLQANPVVSTPQDFMASLELILVEADL
jgi:hypothetical protein